VLALAAPEAAAQFLPWPFTTPVMDVPRRIEARRMDELREVEHRLRRTELAYERLLRSAGPPPVFRDVSGILQAGSRALLAAGGLAGAVGGGASGPAVEAVFYEAYRPGGEPRPGGAGLEGRAIGQAKATLRAHRAMLEASQETAGALERTARYAQEAARLVEQIGQAAYAPLRPGRPSGGRTGSWRGSAETGAMLSIASAEEALLFRQTIAAETGAEITQAADEIAWDALRREAFLRGLYGLAQGEPPADRPPPLPSPQP
jgi:hypothetical protein